LRSWSSPRRVFIDQRRAAGITLPWLEFKPAASTAA
jgi:hypothetical protein